MGFWTVFRKVVCWSSISQYLWRRLYLETESLKMWYNKEEAILDLDGSQIQQLVSLCREKLGNTKTQKSPSGKKAMCKWRPRLDLGCYKPQSTKDCWRAPEARVEAWNTSSPEGTNPVDHLLLDFSLPEHWDNKFLCLWYSATVIL